MTKLVAQSVINSFFDGKHADPFAVLGMHETHNGIEIRALLPDADKVEVIDKESQSIVVELEKLDDRGFFAAIVPEIHHFFTYQLKVYWGVEAQIIEDPYRFHPMINDLDQWLLAEGSLLRPYEVLGAHFTECDSVPGVNFRVWAPNAKRVSLVGDFNFYGGIYRDVNLIITDPVNISLTDYASPGVYLIQNKVTKEQADVKAKVLVSNGSATAQPVKVDIKIWEDDKLVQQQDIKVTVDANDWATTGMDLTIRNPRLWNGRKDPFMYKAEISLLSEGQIIDRIVQPLG